VVRWSQQSLLYRDSVALSTHHAVNHPNRDPPSGWPPHTATGTTPRPTAQAAHRPTPASHTVKTITWRRRSRRSFHDQTPAHTEPSGPPQASSHKTHLTSTNDFARHPGSDVGRYLQILQTRIVRAIGIYLENSGCSAVDFMRQADAITVTNIGQGASVVFGDASNSNIGGENNAVSLPMPAPTPHPTTTTPREQA